MNLKNYRSQIFCLSTRQEYFRAYVLARPVADFYRTYRRANRRRNFYSVKSASANLHAQF